LCWNAGEVAVAGYKNERRRVEKAIFAREDQHV